MTRKCSRKKFKPQELQGMTRPPINSTGNFIYKHVDIYFLAGWQARAVEWMENSNLPVWSPLHSVTRSWEISQIWEIWGVHWDKILICWDIPKLGFLISSIKAGIMAWKQNLMDKISAFLKTFDPFVMSLILKLSKSISDR